MQTNSMDDDDLRYGMRCRFLREELVDLEAGGKVIRTLVRCDGLKHRNVTCAFVIHRDAEAAPGACSGTLITRCFDVCCETSLTIRVRLRVLIGSVAVRSVPWQDGILVRDDAPAVQFSGIIQLGDFEAASAESANSSSQQLVEICLLFDITAASPSFLLAPKVPTFQQTSLCDEEKEMTVVNCSDGSLCVERTLLMRESARWKSRLSDAADSPPIDCTDFSVWDMKVFLFFLQTQLFYDLARFDTFNMMARIAVRHSVSGVVKRCAIFVNECVLLAGSSKPAEASAAMSEAPVSSKIRWTPEDLIAIWCTTINNLGEESLARALMRLICQSSYADIVRLAAFQQLDAATKSTFYHHLLLYREGAAATVAGASGGDSTSVS